MRLSLAVLLTCWMWAAAGAEPPAFPYKAAITANDVYVRSGPGENYYPTEKLKAGQEVEVYRHDPGGWYAILPPQGSFSWVSGRQLDMRKETIAVATEDRVAARVGSRFSDIREVIQVRLHRGETVELLDIKQTGPASASGANTWYKIAPPAGEFRWVSAKFVDSQYARDGLRSTSTGVPLASPVQDRVPLASPVQWSAHVPVTEPGGSAARESNPQSLIPNPQSPIPNPQSPNPSPVREPPVEIYPETTSDQSRADSNLPRTISTEQFQTESNRVEVEISAMVAEEPSVWQFDVLQQRAQALLEQSETAGERGRARLLLSKIARFEDIQRRWQAINKIRDESDRADRQLARLGPRPQGPTLDDAPADRYDAMGHLMRMPMGRSGMPQFALLDADGRVRCYITPGPGVNLRQFLGHDVGVTGVRGYIPEQRAEYLSARHIDMLDGPTWR
ncbi:MAG: SH3 domain-containing protein [Thermoguttaceae bacterium]|jgi:hypothetical protein